MNIIEESRKPGSCLNLKSEWAGDKIPGLQVRVPKGTARDRKNQEMDGKDAIEPLGTDAGTKRIRDEGLHQETKRQRTQDPVQVHTVERREPPRNFLEVALRQKLEDKPNFMPGNSPGNGGKRPEKDTMTRTPVRKKGPKIRGGDKMPPGNTWQETNERYGGAEHRALTPTKAV